MKIRDSFQLSLNSILHRKLRSWLTLLGIVIGVAAVVSIVSIGEGAQASVNAQLSRFGADIITISPGFRGAQGFGGFIREGGNNRLQVSTGRTTGNSTTQTPVLKKLDATVIRGNPDVIAVNEIVSGRGQLVFLSEKTSVNVEGVNPNAWLLTSNVSLASGRFLTPSDSDAIVIGNRLATGTFEQPLTLGRRVSIENRPFTIVGILQSSGSGFGGNDSSVFMTHDSAWDVLAEDTNRNTFSSIQAKVNAPENIERVSKELTAQLMVTRKVNDRTQDFSVFSSQSVQEQISSVTETLTLFLGAIAGVSLVVGAIGIANSMFTSVLEKTKEIGILKALGSSNREILTMFLIESGLFGLIGGLIGVFLGMMVSLGLSGIANVPLPGGRGGFSTLVSPGLMITAIVLSTIIGILSGIWPAQNASKLKPVEALRYE